MLIVGMSPEELTHVANYQKRFILFLTIFCLPLSPWFMNEQVARVNGAIARRTMASQTLELSAYLESKISATAGSEDTAVKYAETGSVMRCGTMCNKSNTVPSCVQ